jgi:hypothetical protein
MKMFAQDFTATTTFSENILIKSYWQSDLRELWADAANF